MGNIQVYFLVSVTNLFMLPLYGKNERVVLRQFIYSILHTSYRVFVLYFEQKTVEVGHVSARDFPLKKPAQLSTRILLQNTKRRPVKLHIFLKACFKPDRKLVFSKLPDDCVGRIRKKWIFRFLIWDRPLKLECKLLKTSRAEAVDSKGR